MILIGHRVTKISGERHDIAEGAALNNISSNAVPTNIREGKSVNPKSKILIVEWEFKSDYDMDAEKAKRDRFTPTYLIQKKCRKWSEIDGQAL